MKAKYCLDTSGISTPVVELPDDVHERLWTNVSAIVKSGIFCWNAEIAKEMLSIPGPIGAGLQSCNGSCCHEIGKGAWPWESYIKINADWQVAYARYISEYQNNLKNTIGLNDMSIVALSKALGLPVVSSETRILVQQNTKKIKIPNLCDLTGVKHLTFHEFCRAEGVKG